MTAVLVRPDSPRHWGSMPGWDVVADLTPPELINTRWIAVLRRRIVIALVAVILLCGAAYAFSAHQYSAASDSADRADTDTIALQHEATRYAPITQIQTTVDAFRSQVAQVMTTDVDVPGVLAAIRLALPTTMSISSLSLTLTPATSDSTAPTGLDASGRAVIGTVTISGSGRTLDDLPTFVDRLDVVRGVVNVVPSSNQVAAGAAQYSVAFSLTDRLYSHRYDLTKTGGR